MTPPAAATGREGKAVSDMFERITFDPKIMGGRACIRGLRMTVSMLVNLVANGMTTQEILKEYPDLHDEKGCFFC